MGYQEEAALFAESDAVAEAAETAVVEAIAVSEIVDFDVFDFLVFARRLLEL